MPQLDPTYFLPQLIWLLICFGVLWAGMHFWIVPRFRSLLSTRQAELQTMVEQTRAYQTQAEGLTSQTQQELHKAQQEATEMIRSAGVLADQRVQASMKELQLAYQARLDQVRHEVNQTIATASDQALQHVPALVDACVEKWFQDPSVLGKNGATVAKSRRANPKTGASASS